jgi:hypothetical protein
MPFRMALQIERTRKAEQRSRSELVREAPRDYFRKAAGFPVVAGTCSLKRARREYLLRPMCLKKKLETKS